MKRLVLLFSALLFLGGCGVLTNFMSINQYIGGYWGQWIELSRWGYYGDPGEFVVYYNSYYTNNHPSDFCYRVTLNNFSKSQLQNGEWRDYYGYIEYYTYAAPTNYKESSRNFVRNDVLHLTKGGNYLVKRPATIKVMMKKTGYTYNVFFDDVGFGVTVPWQNAKSR